MAQRKLNIFNILARINEKDINHFDRLTEEEQKAFLPLIVMRWFSGVSNERQIYFINEIVNPFIFSLHRHKKLLYFLLTICGSGRSQKYFWNKTISKKSSSTPMIIKVIRDYFGYSTLEAIDALPLLSDIDIIIYAEELGRQKDEISKIRKELKSR